MKNFTFKLLTFLFLVFLANATKAKEWNISSATFNALGTISTTTTVDGLKIYASSTSNVVIEANSKSLDGMDFTSRLKLGGTGTFTDSVTPATRILAFDVTGNTTITVMGMSSSSSADRELIVAAGNRDSVIARFPALGASLSKGVVNYFGGPKTIYLYSPSSGVNLYYIKAATYVPDEMVWNISTPAFNALGTKIDTTTVDGLTIYASPTNNVVVEANAKSLDGMDFTYRLKLGGTGSFGLDGMPIARILTFEVSGNSTITVMGMSSSSSADRELIIAAGNKDSIIARFPALGASIGKGQYSYIGKATTIYLYSPSSGVNLYYIKKAKLVTSVSEIKKQDLRIYPNPAHSKVYIDVTEPTQIGIYNVVGNLVVKKTVSSNGEFIDVSHFIPGLYFVRPMTNRGVTQKLVVR